MNKAQNEIKATVSVSTGDGLTAKPAEDNKDITAGHKDDGGRKGTGRNIDVDLGFVETDVLFVFCYFVNGLP